MHLNIIMIMISSHQTHPIRENEVLQSNDLGPCFDRGGQNFEVKQLERG